MYKHTREYWESHLEALTKCKQHLTTSLQLIELDIKGCIERLKRDQDERIKAIEANNYRPYDES